MICGQAAYLLLLRRLCVCQLFLVFEGREVENEEFHSPFGLNQNGFPKMFSDLC